VLSITAFEVLIALALIVFVVTRQRWQLPRIWLPLAIFICGTVVSLAASGHAREGLPQIRKLYIYLMLFLVVSAFQNVRQIRWVGIAWAVAGMLSAAWGLRQYATARDTGYNFYVDHRITGFMDHWMTLGGAMM